MQVSKNCKASSDLRRVLFFSNVLSAKHCLVFELNVPIHWQIDDVFLHFWVFIFATKFSHCKHFQEFANGRRPLLHQASLLIDL